jgi:Gpi18-like mannosyltransferase
MSVSRTLEPRNSLLTTLLPVRDVLLPWFVSRVYAAVLITTFWSVRAGAGLRFAGFTSWDGFWYLYIARHGYGGPPSDGLLTPWPFFPLLPGVIRGLTQIGASASAGPVVLNHLVFLLALAGVWRIALRHVTPAAARLAVWSLALFPGAFIFSMVYPSAIFLAASVWAFVFVEERHDVMAGVMVVAVTLVRPNGLVLAIALLLALRSIRRVLIVCAPAFAAFGIWCTLCWYWTRDPFVFLSSKDAWHEITILEVTRHVKASVYPHLLLAIAAMVAVLICRRRLPASWTAFTALYLLPSLGLGMAGLGRYANETFPPFVAAGDLLHRASSWVRVAAFSLAIAGQALCAWWVLHDLYTP